jgi:signal transduction histidine kinase
MSRHLQLVLLWIFLQAVFAGWFISNRMDLIEQRFEQDTRLGQRLMAQELSELDAILDALVIYDVQAQAGPDLSGTYSQLAIRYPAILDLARYRSTDGWQQAGPGPLPDAVARAMQQSLTLRRAVMTPLEGRPRTYWLVLAQNARTGFALKIQPSALVPVKDWPASLHHVKLRYGLTSLDPVVLPHQLAESPMRFVIAQRLPSHSQPLVIQTETRVGFAQLPWEPILSLALASALILWGLNAFLDQRETVLRARRQTHFVQVARLNTLGEMAARLAHEINQPLTAIFANWQASVRMLEEEEVDMELVRESIGTAAAQAKRAAGIISRLREDLERPRQERPEPPMRLVQMVDEVLFLLEPDCNARAIRIRFSRRDESVAIRADRVAIEQVIHNLLSNALEAMRETQPERRLIELALYSRGHEPVLTVSDKGAGIPPEVLPRLFEPFFTTRKTGMGLGLSICETLIGQFGGAISAENRPAGGARFTVVLPRVESA